MTERVNGEKVGSESGVSWLIWIVLLLLLGLVHLGLIGGSFITLLLWVLIVGAIFSLVGRACAYQARDRATEDNTPDLSALLNVRIDDVFVATEHRRSSVGIDFDGRLLVAPDKAAGVLSDRFGVRGWTPVLTQKEGGQATLSLTPETLTGIERPARGPALHILLIALTLATTTWAGALHQGINLLQQPGRFTAGMPYALALMTILGAHEMGHYVTARRYGMRVTLPYFIPVPFALGTFGAFIQLRSPSPSRRALFDVGVAGPLAGLVVAIPALFVGLPLSAVTVSATAPGLHLSTDAGASILLALVARVVIPDALAQAHVLILHPLAFAGWLGLLITALNLLPIGQLDGGHMADAMFGQRASGTVSTVAMVALVLLGLFVWSGLLYWAFIAFFIAGRKGVPPINDVTELDPRRQALGVFAFALLVAILLPVPHGLYETLGITCPYV
jgi:Peptidase family M50